MLGSDVHSSWFGCKLSGVASAAHLSHAHAMVELREQYSGIKGCPEGSLTDRLG